MSFKNKAQQAVVMASLRAQNKINSKVAQRFYSATPGKIGKSDKVVLVEGKPTLYLYNTPIAQRVNGEIVTRTDGYRTKTTKERLNAIVNPTGHTIVQRKGRWQIVDDEGHVSQYEEGSKFPVPPQERIDDMRFTSMTQKEFDGGSGMPHALPSELREKKKKFSYGTNKELSKWDILGRINKNARELESFGKKVEYYPEDVKVEPISKHRYQLTPKNSKPLKGEFTLEGMKDSKYVFMKRGSK